MRLDVVVKHRCDISITDKYCLFGGNAATGKTYMCRFIKDYCSIMDRQCVHLNYTISRESIIALIGSIKDDETVTIVDNADIIMDHELELLLYNKPGMKIVMLRDHSNMPLFASLRPTIYSVYADEEGCLHTRRGDRL